MQKFASILILMLSLTLALPSAVQANGAIRKIANEILRTIARNAQKDIAAGKIITHGWEQELNTAIREVLARRGKEIDRNLLNVVKKELSTPRSAIDFAYQSNLQRGLIRQYSKWEIAIRAFDQGGTLSKTTAVEALQSQFSALATHEVAQGNLRLFYLEEVMDLFKLVKNRPVVMPEVNRSLKTLEAIFRSSLEVAKLSPEARGLLVESMDAANMRLRQGIESLKSPHLLRAKVDFDLLPYIKNLEKLGEKIGSYSFTLVSKSVVYGIETDFLLAQIRHGTVQVKKQALQLLMVTYGTSENAIAKSSLREVFTQANNELREYAVTLLKRQGVAPDITNALEELLAITKMYFPGERAFEQAAEGMVNLAAHWDVGQLALILEATEKPLMEKIGAVRALGRLNSRESFEILIRKVFNVEIHDAQLAQAYIEELAASLRTADPERLKTVLSVLKALATHSSSAPLKINSIRGLGEVLSRSSNPEHVDLLITLFEEFGNAQLKAEVVMALSKLKPSKKVIDLLVPLLSQKNANLKVAAANYLMKTHEVPSLQAFISSMGVSEGAISEHFRLLAMRHMRENLTDFVALRGHFEKLAQSSSMEVRLEALSILAKNKDPKAVQWLLESFEVALGSQKRDIVQMLLLNYEDKVVLRQALKKIIQIYENPNLNYSFFDQFTDQFALLQRFALLKGDLEAFSILDRAAQTHDPMLQEFIGAVLTSIK